MGRTRRASYGDGIKAKIRQDEIESWLKKMLSEISMDGITKDVRITASRIIHHNDPIAALMGLYDLPVAETTWEKNKTEICVQWISAQASETDLIEIKFQPPVVCFKVKISASVTKSPLPKKEAEDELASENIRKIIILSGATDREEICRRALAFYLWGLEKAGGRDGTILLNNLGEEMPETVAMKTF